MTKPRSPRCPRCGGEDLEGPAPVRTAAHPNSSAILVETPGAHFHDFVIQGSVCLGCGAVLLSLPGPTLETFRKSRSARGRRRR